MFHANRHESLTPVPVILFCWFSIWKQLVLSYFMICCSYEVAGDNFGKEPWKSWNLHKIRLFGCRYIRLFFQGRALRREVFMKVGYRVAFCLDIGRGPRKTRRGNRIYGVSMVHKVGFKAAFLYLLRSKIFCELVNHGADHFQVSELLCTYWRTKLFMI